MSCSPGSANAAPEAPHVPGRNSRLRQGNVDPTLRAARRRAQFPRRSGRRRPTLCLRCARTTGPPEMRVVWPARRSESRQPVPAIPPRAVTPALRTTTSRSARLMGALGLGRGGAGPRLGRPGCQRPATAPVRPRRIAVPRRRRPPARRAGDRASTARGLRRPGRSRRPRRPRRGEARPGEANDLRRRCDRSKCDARALIDLDPRRTTCALVARYERDRKRERAIRPRRRTGPIERWSSRSVRRARAGG